MDEESWDQRVRSAAFAFLEELSARQPDGLPHADLVRGFFVDGVRVPLLGPQGIFKPRVLRYPLSITTAPPVPGRPRPYDDRLGEDAFLLYCYRGDDTEHPVNRGLRQAMRRQLPLVYFHGVARGVYLAQWPVFIRGDDPRRLTFTVEVDDPLASELLAEGLPDPLRRAYANRLARQRLHQQEFRRRVMIAYRERCAMCRLAQRELLDAAHILPDIHPRGEPVTANAMALCKLHHAAFDGNLLGVRPDLVIQVRTEVLQEIDGPMLRHGLQELHGQRLIVIPRSRWDRPDPERLEERYQLFRAAG